MNRITRALAVAACIFAPVALAQTAAQKVDETANSAKATSKKAMHRVSEAACTGTRAECEKQKLHNKVDETKDDAKNKTKETLDKAP